MGMAIVFASPSEYGEGVWLYDDIREAAASWDRGVYGNAPDTNVSRLKQWVLDGNAPSGLYEAFQQPPESTFEDEDKEE